MESQHSVGFYTHALHDALVKNPGGHKALYMDSAAALFIYATEKPKGNCQPLTTEKVIHLIESERKEAAYYSTTLKIQAFQTLHVYLKDREEHFKHDYQGLIGTIKRLFSFVSNYIQGYGGIDNAEKERKLITSHMISLNVEIQKEESAAKREAAAAQARLKQTTQPDTPVKPKRTITAQMPAPIPAVTPPQPPAPATTTVKQPPKPKTPLYANNSLGRQGGKYLELAQMLMGEGNSIDDEPNGPCTQGLYSIWAAALNGATLLDVKKTPTKDPAIVKYEMTVDSARTGTLENFPGRFFISQKIPFTLEDKEGRKVLTFLDKSVFVRVGYTAEKKEEGLFGALKAAAEAVASKDVESQLHFEKDGMVLMATSVKNISVPAIQVADALYEVQWSKTST